MKAAVGCKKAGFDGIEIHGAHGLTINESKKVAAKLEKTGVDVIDVFAGHINNSMIPILPDKTYPYGTFVHLAREIKTMVNIPVVAVGRIHTFHIAEHVLKTKSADFIAVGRGLLADPLFARKIFYAETEKIIACKSCNTCIKTISKGKQLVCAVNSELD